MGPESGHLALSRPETPGRPRPVIRLGSQHVPRSLSGASAFQVDLLPQYRFGANAQKKWSWPLGHCPSFPSPNPFSSRKCELSDFQPGLVTSCRPLSSRGRRSSKSGKRHAALCPGAPQGVQ